MALTAIRENSEEIYRSAQDAEDTERMKICLRTSLVRFSTSESSGHRSLWGKIATRPDQSKTAYTNHG